MDRPTKNEFCLQIEVFQRITQIYLYLFIVNLQITEITVFTLSWQMLELGLKRDEKKILGCMKMSLLLFLGGLKLEITLKTSHDVFFHTPFNIYYYTRSSDGANE